MIRTPRIKVFIRAKDFKFLEQLANGWLGFDRLQKLFVDISLTQCHQTHDTRTIKSDLKALKLTQAQIRR